MEAIRDSTGLRLQALRLYYRYDVPWFVSVDVFILEHYRRFQNEQFKNDGFDGDVDSHAHIYRGASGGQIRYDLFALARALKKLHAVSQRIPMEANPATSHMFIVNPLSGGGLLRLFSAHPPIEERISRLEAMARGR